MADLSTLDATKPDNSELARQGAGRIRDVAVATKTSVQFEHDLTGYHRFPSGLTSDRPAAGKAGRIFVNFERESIERDDGAGWGMLRVGANGRNHVSTSDVLSAVSFGSVVSVNANIPQNGYIHVDVTFQIDFDASASGAVLGKLKVNGVDYGPTWTWSIISNEISSYHMSELIVSGLVEGVNNIDWQMRSTVGSQTITDRVMITRGR